jgi:hypothetical protein
MAMRQTSIQFAISLLLISGLALLTACSGSSSSSATAIALGSAATSTNTIATGKRVLVSWTPPAFRENQTPLPPTDIKGYHIYFRNLSVNGPEASINLADNNTSQYALALAQSGTYEFSISVYDWNDLESQRSQKVNITIQ